MQLLGNTEAGTRLRHPREGIAQLRLAHHVPDGAPFLTYKAVARRATFRDGEEGYLPVLSRRILVTESLPLPIRGRPAATKKFEFTKLLNSGNLEDPAEPRA